MNLVRRPERGEVAVLRLPPAPPLDTTPGALLPAPALAAHPPHLVPCVVCGALNGRSALACWTCEADLIAAAPFARPATNRPVEPAVEPAPSAGVVTVTAPGGAADGRRGLHLVSRGEAPESIEAAPSLPARTDAPDLTVLTALLEGEVPLPAQAALPLKARRRGRPLISLAVLACALLAAAAGLRWFAPVPGPLSGPSPAAAAPQLEGARLERPFRAPAPSVASDATELSFPPVEVVPRRLAPPPSAWVSAAPRPAPKPREIRETISPPAAACTSNMAALGFCTLPPASAKE